MLFQITMLLKIEIIQYYYLSFKYMCLYNFLKFQNPFMFKHFGEFHQSCLCVKQNQEGRGHHIPVTLPLNTASFVTVHHHHNLLKQVVSFPLRNIKMSPREIRLCHRSQTELSAKLASEPQSFGSVTHSILCSILCKL